MAPEQGYRGAMDEPKTVTKNVTVLTENIPKLAKLIQDGFVTS
jgi:hypothetical protein